MTAVPKRRRMSNLARKIARWLLVFAAAFFVATTLLAVLYGAVAPPATPLMLIRAVQGDGLTRHWKPYAEVSPHLIRAVIAAEDARFCEHAGFDWREIEKAWASFKRGGHLRGASTITMQTAKNLFLWPGRSYLRKGLEVYFTLLLELALDKQRIIELYVNVAEWGRGIYGAEAAAQAYFKKPAAGLTRREAALLAAVLPNPRRWAADRPTASIVRKAVTIQARMRSVPISEGRLCR
ncbi:MAG: monofunctional biosynthetic peptidoglycan transglycosylase [Dongiaceae bacterium]